MKVGRASRTAQQNALFRALETARPAGERICDDPLARHFLSWPLSQAGQIGSLPGLRRLFPAIIDYRWPGVRSSVVARTRLIDEMITAALSDPVEQFVLLGAGFDSRAYRLPCLRTVKTIFEVDHPATQASKRNSLARALAIPANVRFVSIDFQQQDLATVMSAVGFSESKRTFILWEGVSNYLNPDAFDAVLRWCTRSVAGSQLLYTYVHRDILTNPEKFAGTANLFRSLATSGEPFTFGMLPSEMPAYLAERGLELEIDIGAAEFRRRFYGDAAQRMVGHEFYRVALAHVVEG